MDIQQYNKVKNDQYVVNLNHYQLRVIVEALEVIMRLGLGQIEYISDVMSSIHFKKTEDQGIDFYKIKEKYLDPMKQELLNLQSNQYFSISSNHVEDRVKVAYDIMKAMQKVISEKENHERFSVWRDGNILHLGSAPKIKIEER